MSGFTFTVGAALPSITQESNLVTSVMYAGASGDYNPLHYDPAFAGMVSPTGAPIAHGMYSMGLVSRLLTAAAGGPERVLELQVRFSKPWPLGTTAVFSGTVTAVEDGIATVDVVGEGPEGVRILAGTGRLRV
jgi:acyl dehydratase